MPGAPTDARIPHSSHWGAFDALVTDGRIVGTEAFPDDPEPSPLLLNIPQGVHGRARVQRPAVRAGWLDDGPGPDDRRGRDAYVELDWDEALDLLAGELRRVYDGPGPAGVFGGSYGWSSAGRFHHAQSQLHRFLNTLGGFTRSVGSYSHAATEVLLPRVLASLDEVLRRATAWPVVAEHTDLIVAFGGVPLKNTAVTPGGRTRHLTGAHLERAASRGMRAVLVSPVRDDMTGPVPVDWLPVSPGTDVAAMLALSQVLVAEDRYDRAFVDRYCVGFEAWAAYLSGDVDGQPKTPEWAEALCGLAAGDLRRLARRMTEGRTLVTITYSLQRSRHGEQPLWAAIALASLLGQMGLPGGGFGHGYGSMGDVGAGHLAFKLPTLAQGHNPERAFIPVARIADMLLHPGDTFDFDGRQLAYPDARLVYWCGGNPFHHHQDLNRLRRALARPDTVVVHEPGWTGMARHADIVLPVTTTLERDDLGAGRNDAYLHAMRRAVAPVGEARDDHAVFAALADRLGVADAFTEGRDVDQWLRHLYEAWRCEARATGFEAPPFEQFWQAGSLRLPDADDARVLFSSFRADPEAHPLPTPSGRIELCSSAIASFDYDDCPPHPAWLEPEEWLHGRRAEDFPILLIANNPATRLHSQFDEGAHSQGSKVQGREPIRLHPADARTRGVGDGDVVRVFNDRGACLAGVALTDGLRPGVAQLSTGAWWDPLDRDDPRALCVHGNPNVLTADVGTSRLAQGSTGQHVLVQIERWQGSLPPVHAHEPPPFRRA